MQKSDVKFRENFSRKFFPFFGGGFKLLLAQLAGIGSVFVWTFGSMLLIFFLIKKTMGLRVSREEELKGLDIDEHGMEAYSGFQIFQND